MNRTRISRKPLDRRDRGCSQPPRCSCTGRLERQAEAEGEDDRGVCRRRFERSRRTSVRRASRWATRSCSRKSVYSDQTKSRQIGTDEAFCVRTVVGEHQLCTGIFYLHGGSITITGPGDERRPFARDHRRHRQVPRRPRRGRCSTRIDPVSDLVKVPDPQAALSRPDLDHAALVGADADRALALGDLDVEAQLAPVDDLAQLRADPAASRPRPQPRRA